MQPWEILALLFAGAVGVGSLAKSSAAAAAAQTAISPADMDLLNRAFRAAITTETDHAVLANFSRYLRAAGFASYADAVDRRATFVTNVMTLHPLSPIIQKVTP